MCWLAVDKNGSELIFTERPIRAKDFWISDRANSVHLDEGSIFELTKIDLSWNDEPVEI